MRDLATFVWYMIGAILFFGVWAVIAIVVYIILKVCVGFFKPEWMEKF